VPAPVRFRTVFHQRTLDVGPTDGYNDPIPCLLGMPRSVSRPRIEAVINRLGLASDKATKLSGGSRRRAELIRVLLHNRWEP
jgi:ABC-type phosphate/phosphonate transport system ATPase subunit